MPTVGLSAGFLYWSSKMTDAIFQATSVWTDKANKTVINLQPVNTCFGNIEITTLNAEAAAEFEVGNQYTIDIKPIK